MTLEWSGVEWSGVGYITAQCTVQYSTQIEVTAELQPCKCTYTVWSVITLEWSGIWVHLFLRGTVYIYMCIIFMCFIYMTVYISVTCAYKYRLDDESRCLWDLDHRGNECIDIRARSVRASIRFPR